MRRSKVMRIEKVDFLKFFKIRVCLRYKCIFCNFSDNIEMLDLI